MSNSMEYERHGTVIAGFSIRLRLIHLRSIDDVLFFGGRGSNVIIDELSLSLLFRICWLTTLEEVSADK